MKWVKLGSGAAVLVLSVLAGTVLYSQTTRTVCASGCDHTTIQAALTAAVCGDTVSIAYTESFAPTSGQFNLAKICADNNRIIVRSSASDGQLPPAGQRATTGELYGVADGTVDYRPFMPNITQATAGANLITTSAGASGYTLIGLELNGTAGGFGAIAAIGSAGSDQQFVADEPKHITFDRVIVKGNAFAGQKLGIALHGANLAVLNSSITEVKGVGQDAIAISCVNGSGPIRIINNLVSSAAENFLCGGADPQMRTNAEANAGATTTTATLSTFRAGHTIATLHVGQAIAILAGGGTPMRHQSYVRSCGTSTPGAVCSSNTITYDVIPSAPNTGAGSNFNWGVIPNGFTIRRNYFFKPVAWMNPIYAAIGTVTPTTALGGGGTLVAGTYYYRVQGINVNGYNNANNFGTASVEVSATLTATGSITLTWPAVADVTGYNIGGRLSGTQTVNNAANVIASVTTSACTAGVCTFTDTGSNMATPNDMCTGTSNAQSICSISKWAVKNLLEIKFGTNYQIDSNIFEYTWPGVDTGYAFWLKSNNSEGNAEFAQTKDVVIERNIIRHVDGFANILGRINSAGTGTGENQSFFIENMTIRDNLIDDSDDAWLQGGSSVLAFKMEGPTRNVRIENNTVIHQMRGFINMYTGGSPPLGHDGLVIRNNILRKETYGIFGVSCTPGTQCLNSATSGVAPVFDGNVMAGASAATYPAGNLYPTVADFEANHFENYNAGNGGNYTLRTDSSWLGTAVGGGDPGANIAGLNAATNGVKVGAPEGAVTPVSITTTGLTDGMVSVPYSFQIQASNGTTPYTFTRPVGTWPAGISMSTAGLITGTPTTAGSQTVTVRVTDSAGTPLIDDQVLTLLILPAVTTLNITTTTLPNGTVPTPYTQTLAVTGGTAPYVWSIASGALPTGVTLSTAGVIAGVPAVAGAASFTVQATDAGGITDTQALSITVVVETLPCGRPRNRNYTEATIFRRPAAPVAASPDCAAIGDLWLDLSTSPPQLKVANSATPTWAVLSTLAAAHALMSHSDTEAGTAVEGSLLIGTANGTFTLLPPSSTEGSFLRVTGGSVDFGTDGSALTALRADNLTTGQVPAARLGTGTASASTYLRGNGTWGAPSAYYTLAADVSKATTGYGDITGLSFPILANTNYEVLCTIAGTANTQTTGYGVVWVGPASPTMTWGMTVGSVGANSISGSSFAGDDSGNALSGVYAVQPVISTMIFQGIWRNGANAGTIQMRFRPEIADTVTIKAGSVCKVTTF